MAYFKRPLASRSYGFNRLLNLYIYKSVWPKSVFAIMAILLLQESAMLKSIIVLLLIGILISLIVGFIFFYKDQGRSKRVLYALGVRVTLAVIMMACIFYGLTTGELTLNAPWL